MAGTRVNAGGRAHNEKGRFTRKTPRTPDRQSVSENAVTVGSKAQVFHGTAKHTSGGLTQKDLMMNKHGRIVSRRQHASGKKSIKHLTNAGYIAKKGTFKLMKKH
jgi:hypothetical protein